MEDSHLTLRLSADVVQSLERLAESRGMPKSRLVREAVAQYLSGDAPRPESSPLLARDFKAVWESLPHLSVDEATRLDTDLQRARAALAPPGDPWA
jgi:hypothetical protein